MTAPRSVVLVHGSWHGAWCWDKVVGPLRARGVDVTALDLPGHGESTEPLGDMHADAVCITAALDRATRPVVLVGHSSGGMPITEAGVHPAVEHLVYLSAFMPDTGESLRELYTSDTTPIAQDGSILEQPDGTTIIDLSMAVAAFYADCDPAEAAAAVARLGPQNFAGTKQPPNAIAWHTKPSTFVVCTRDESIQVPLLRRMATRATDVVEWDTSHSPFLSRPDLVIDLLDRLAR